MAFICTYTPRGVSIPRDSVPRIYELFQWLVKSRSSFKNYQSTSLVHEISFVLAASRSACKRVLPSNSSLLFSFVTVFNAFPVKLLWIRVTWIWFFFFTKSHSVNFNVGFSRFIHNNLWRLINSFYTGLILFVTENHSINFCAGFLHFIVNSLWRFRNSFHVGLVLYLRKIIHLNFVWDFRISFSIIFDVFGKISRNHSLVSLRLQNKNS